MHKMWTFISKFTVYGFFDYQLIKEMASAQSQKVC